MTARDRFAGMSYEQASREAERLVRQAAATGLWWPLVDDLAEMRRIMHAHLGVFGRRVRRRRARAV